MTDHSSNAHADPTHDLLFSYGTLRDPEVQQHVFGREIQGRRDAVVGYVLREVLIVDPGVIALSGTDRHTGLHATGDQRDRVEGTVFEITCEQLRAVDQYESAYERLELPLAGGGEAWAYLPPSVPSGKSVSS